MELTQLSLSHTPNTLGLSLSPSEASSASKEDFRLRISHEVQCNLFTKIQTGQNSVSVILKQVV